jgi:putative transcriptional regulator
MIWRISLTEIIIRNQIRRLRFNNGEMTQGELARRSGCTRQTINAIEAAKYGPSLELAFKIAQVFGVGIEDVFQYEVLALVEDEFAQNPP